MIFTARQLEDLHKSDGHVRLPIGARLTPLASDWVRRRKIEVLYDGQSSSVKSPSVETSSSATPTLANATLWWCDGPCGPAKAALAAQASETNLQPMNVTAEPKHLVSAVKHLAGEIRGGRATSGVLLVQTGAAAMVYANRCPSLRAILGTCREAVQQGVEQLAANVLVIEYPYQTLQQVKNLLSLFFRARREPSDDVKRQLQELASCG
jgi:ribose 5-phosphate isomerase RpiB